MAEILKILLIDDDENLNRVISYQLEKMGFVVKTALDGIGGLEKFKQEDFDIILTDLQLPGLSGMELLRAIRHQDKNVILIVITAYGTVENAIEASHLGADDYLTKPFGKETLRFVIEKAVRLRRLQTENIRLRAELFKHYDFSSIVAKSPSMGKVLSLTGRVAESDATVLILGESGTGKELIARALHYNSPRKDRPFITVNCPSIPESLMESELFGHVKGAFTGALRDRVGKFQLADQGSIFLDEIGDLKGDLQARLLRVLQEKEFERVGESHPKKVDVRVIAATNKDLQDWVKTGKFREDLYYRLNVVSIHLPPLRERKEDIPFLVDHFVQKYQKDREITIRPDSLNLLLDYDWPGNVRELENTIARAIVLSQESAITPEALQLFRINKSEAATSGPGHSAAMTLAEAERQAIARALEQADGNQSQAARILGIPRHVLLYRMKKLQVR